MPIRFPFELLVWVSGLLFLATTSSGEGHSSLCPLHNLGITWCPGCGLGRSIRHILQGQFSASLDDHWFGFPSLAILFWRIVVLFRKFMVNLLEPKPNLS